ncbi:hypothetical protein ACJJTC_002372 [Scirpophaga incertulas]
MPPPTVTVPSSEDSTDVDEELRAMEQQPMERPLTPKPQRLRTDNQPADVARPVAVHAATTTADTQARAATAPAAGTTRPVAASGGAPRKAATPPARPVTAHATNRPTKAIAGSSARPVTPSHARPGPAPATYTKKTPMATPKTPAPSSEEMANPHNIGEKQETSRVAPKLRAALEDLTTPRIPATYAEKMKKIATHQLATKIEIKDPRMIRQRSLESIQRRPTTPGSQDASQQIAFDRSSRTVSPSNLKPISPTPFPSRHSQPDLRDAQLPQRETRKRQLEADETTATQPAKMIPPALITTPPTPPAQKETVKQSLQVVADVGATRRKRRGGKGRRKMDATQNLGTNAEAPPTTAPTRTSTTAEVRVPREPSISRQTGANMHNITKPSEVPVVAASTQRTKAKPATSERTPTTAEQTAASTVEEIISLLQSAFVAAMTGESLITIVSRSLMELWRLLSRVWTRN